MNVSIHPKDFSMITLHSILKLYVHPSFLSRISVDSVSVCCTQDSYVSEKD